MKLINFFIFFSPLLNLIYSTLDINHLYNGVWLSGAAYCDKEEYKNMSIGGTALGFSYKNTIYDIKTDIQGYIGTLSTTKSIYIVLRGSSSKINWLDDFEISLIPYVTYPQCNCSVHKGFYDSVLSIRNKTIDTINFLKKIYPTYSVVITGHSYGASCGQLLAMELQKEGIVTKIYNYGQPRVGDLKYALYVNNVIKEYWRVTHDKDVVPHLPPIEFNYKHSCQELFEDETGKLNECSNINCEDAKCSNQYNIYQTNSNDHLYYLQHRLSCNDSII